MKNDIHEPFFGTVTFQSLTLKAIRTYSSGRNVEEGKSSVSDARRKLSLKFSINTSVLLPKINLLPWVLFHCFATATFLPLVVIRFTTLYVLIVRT